MLLSVKRVLFTRLISDLILWAHTQRYMLAFGEGYVALTDAADGDHDGPHKAGGAHYTGLGQDLILYIEDRYVADGTHPAWAAIGTHWEGMDLMCRWGGRFTPPDANHFSLFHEGRI